MTCSGDASVSEIRQIWCFPAGIIEPHGLSKKAIAICVNSRFHEGLLRLKKFPECFSRFSKVLVRNFRYVMFLSQIYFMFGHIVTQKHVI